METSLLLSSSKSSDPAVILLIGSNDQLELLDCIANDFLKTINKAYNEENSNQINGKQTNTNDIREKFEQTFGIQRKHTIIVKNIESIPSDHIMALHQFTDHQNSIFPDSIIIMTAVLKHESFSYDCFYYESDKFAIENCQKRNWHLIGLGSKRQFAALIIDDNRKDSQEIVDDENPNVFSQKSTFLKLFFNWI